MKAYHGTNKENFKKILKSGYFKKGTWFALNIEDARAYGGNYIFECEFNNNKFNGEESWQFFIRNDFKLKELKTIIKEKGEK